MFTSLQASTHSTCSARHEQETSFGLLLSKEASKQTTTAGKARTSEDLSCLRSLASLQVIAVGPGIVLANGPALSTRGKVMRCSHDSTQLRSVLKVFAASCSTTDPTETQSRGSRQGSDAKSRGNQAVKAVPARGRAALACAGGTCQDSNQRYPKSDASCWYSDNE